MAPGSRKSPAWVLVLAFLLALACPVLAAAEPSKAESYGEYGGPFALVDQRGRAVTDEDFRGRQMLLFFGYTYCPDICPTSMQVIGDTLDILGDEGRDIQPIFITLDPERDTPEVLAGFVANFHPRMLGLTGPKDRIAAVADDYGVAYYKVFFPPSVGAADDDENADYLLSHSGATYLMGPDGRFVTYFSYGTRPEDMAREIRRRGFN